MIEFVVTNTSCEGSMYTEEITINGGQLHEHGSEDWVYPIRSVSQVDVYALNNGDVLRVNTSSNVRVDLKLYNNLEYPFGGNAAYFNVVTLSLLLLIPLVFLGLPSYVHKRFNEIPKLYLKYHTGVEARGEIEEFSFPEGIKPAKSHFRGSVTLILVTHALVVIGILVGIEFEIDGFLLFEIFQFLDYGFFVFAAYVIAFSLEYAVLSKHNRFSTSEFRYLRSVSLMLHLIGMYIVFPGFIPFFVNIF